MRLSTRHFLLGILFISTLAQAKLDESVALEEVIREGLQNAFGIKTQQLKLEKAYNNRTNAWLGLLPTVTVSGDRTYTKADSLVSGSKETTGTWGNTLEVTGQWTVWDGFQKITNIRREISSLESERISTTKRVQTYILELLTAYLEYQILLNRKQAVLALHEESSLLAREAEALVKAGAKTMLDTIDTEVQVINSDRDLLEVESNITLKERSLKVLLNSEKYKSIPQINILSLKPYFIEGFEEKISKIRQSWESNFVNSNLDLQIAQTQLDQSLMNLTQSKLRYIPTTSISLSHTVDLNGFVNPETTSSKAIALHQTKFTLGFSWQIWDWFSTHREIRNVDKDHEIALLNLRETHLRSKTEFQNFLDQYEVFKKTIEASELLVSKAEKMTRFYREMYRLGRGTLISVQQANSRLFDARVSLADRLKEKYLLIAKILYSTGYDLAPPVIR